MIRGQSGAILIDAGLDEDAGKKIKKALDTLVLPLRALLITHAHADHFGGAAYLRKVLPPFTVYAPALESALIENPILEGVFLSAGAWPFDALAGKFTRAAMCKVDHELKDGTLELDGISLTIHPAPGHSLNQKMVQYEQIWFTADAFLPVETIGKYPVPFLVHAGHTLATLDTLSALTDDPLVTFAPGHGAALTGSVAHETISANRNALTRVIEVVRSIILSAENGVDEGSLTQTVCHGLGDPLATPVSYYLARSTIQATLVYLYEAGAIKWASLDGRMVWVRA